jgi:hypothetical protein
MNFPDQFSLPSEVLATMSAYARLVDDKLPGRIRGIYLIGSVALNDYRPGTSDIDFVAVSDTTLDASEIEWLGRVHTELRRMLPTPKLDCVYLTWSALAAAPVGFSAPYCLRGQFEPKGDFAITPVTWWTLHRHPIPLRGPARPIVHQDDQMLREWCRENLHSYWGSYVRIARGYGVHRLCSLMREPVVWGVLGVSRPHATIRTGEMISKTAAGAYALDVFPSRWSPIVREALAGRCGNDRSSYRNIFARRRDLLGFMEYVISDALQ